MNFESRKGRSINPKLKVKIYRNLNKKGVVYSIVQKGVVVGYTSRINLTNCIFKVSETGRQRVLKEKRKNVHAYVVGYLTNETLINGNTFTYNPYKNKTFIDKQTGQQLLKANTVSFNYNDKYYK